MNKELTQAFLSLRNQAIVHSDDKSINPDEVYGRPRKRVPTKGSGYDEFLHKYENLEEYFEDLNTKDLVFFFRQKAEEAGVKYTISNMKRDLGIFKKLRNDYDISEILLMIEFIFSGDQTYLDITHTQPTVLSSNWVNTIYPDSLLWAKDEYIDKKTITTKTKRNEKREWKSSKKKKKIGEW